MNIEKNLKGNPFINFCMRKIPDDPHTQSLYVYILTWVVFIGLLGYGVISWYSFFLAGGGLKNLFSALFMTAIGLISLFGLKQTRNQYLIVKQMKENPQPIQSFEEMMKEAAKT